MIAVEQIMGMPIVVESSDASEETVARVFDWFRWVDETFSTYKNESEVSRIARGELAIEDAHPHVREVLERCEELRGETDGYFDAHAGGELDPCGLVKGWSVDRAAEILETTGAQDFAVNVAGDARVRGRAWRVGIEHPLDRRAVAAVVESDDLAIATSGAYLRGNHVLNPHTGRPPEDVLSVTVTGPDLATADAYATAAFAMGKRGPHWTARLRGYEAMTILADQTVLTTPNFPAAD